MYKLIFYAGLMPVYDILLSANDWVKMEAEGYLILRYSVGESQTPYAAKATYKEIPVEIFADLDVRLAGPAIHIKMRGKQYSAACLYN